MNTPTEWKDAFNVLYDNNSNKAPGLDDYEISLFLTLGQEDIIRSYFNPKRNKVMEGFEMSYQRSIEFSSIVKTITYKDGERPTSPITARKSKFLPLGFNIQLPNNVFIVTNVYTSTGDLSGVTPILPIDMTTFDSFMSKPFKRPFKGMGYYMLLSNGNVSEECPECMDIDVLNGAAKVTIRYIERPTPIIVGKLIDTNINGYTEPCSCKLNPNLHNEILKRGVELARAHYTGDLSTAIAIGNTSQTDLGIIPQNKERD